MDLNLNSQTTFRRIYPNVMNPVLTNTQNFNLYNNFIHNHSSNLSIGTLFISRAELPKFNTTKNITHTGLQSAIPTNKVKLSRK